MITIRKSNERGYFNFEWLETYHTFSFGDYYDPKYVQFHNLRVINEDRVQPDQGFDSHPHKNMEIVTYVLAGQLAHRDSMGNGSIIQAGDIQCMSAGTGVTHSEFNPSQTDPVHLLQIWILPREREMQPRYQQIHVSTAEKQGDLRLIASPDGEDGTVLINADARIFASVLSPGQSFVFEPYQNRSYWLQIARGVLHVNNIPLIAGDGASFSDEGPLTFKSTSDTEFLLFELP